MKENLLAKGMELAIAQAEMALRKGEIPVGAALVRANRVPEQECGFAQLKVEDLFDTENVICDHNRTQERKNPLAHAEILVLERAIDRGWDVRSCALYITLEPCSMCTGALGLAQIGRVIFGAYSPKTGALGGVRPDKDPLPEARVIGGVCETRCGAILRDFFSDLR